jgi:hypothetical protein
MLESPRVVLVIHMGMKPGIPLPSRVLTSGLLGGAQITGGLIPCPRLDAANIKPMAHTSAISLSLLFIATSSPWMA